MAIHMIRKSDEVSSILADAVKAKRVFEASPHGEDTWFLRFPDRTKNPFRLFDNKPNWKEAEARLESVCAKAAWEIVNIAEDHWECGVSDTDSREAIADYLWDLVCKRLWERWYTFLTQKGPIQ